MKQLIVFDWDDVLTEGSKEWYFSLYHDAIAAVGVSLGTKEEERRIVAKWGRPSREELAELVKEHPERLDAAAQVYETLLHEGNFAKHVRLMDGAAALLERLKKTYALAIATGMNGDLLRGRMIPELGLPDVFSKIVSTDDFHDPTKFKPSPFALECIMKELGHTPEATVMVGDAEGDVRMAQSAGVEPIVVLSGHLNREAAERLGVRHIIDDVTQLESVLERFA